MTILLISLATLIFTGILSVAAGRRTRWAVRLGCGGAAAGCLLGAIPAVHAMLGGGADSIDIPWSLPGGEFSMGLDPLSGLFLTAIMVVSGLAALYGCIYLKPTEGRPAVGPAWWWFNLLIASLAVVAVARNAVLFLMAWEMMTLASFFLVVWDDGEKANRRAGWIYLVAAHVGTAFLIVFFTGLARSPGGFALDPRYAPAPSGAGWLFLTALIGFGTKAGFVPLHVWLPEAHPAAPSHVSAVMSGVMIKAGIYGLVRAMTLLGPWQEWWGWGLLAIGVSSGLLGVLNALAQHDLKRLLAYHSVENIGIIAMGIGLGIIAEVRGYHGAAVLALAGALLHVLNHAVFKGLLFLGAGSVMHATGTRHIDELGGLLKRLPWTGTAFIVGAVAIAGLPPLNGFVSEFLIFLGSFRLVAGASGGGFLASIISLAGLAMIGTLATACFAKVVGIVFLGEPRSARAGEAHESPPGMVAPMAVLATLCVAGGLAAPWIMTLLRAPLGTIFPAGGIQEAGMDCPGNPLAWVGAFSAALVVLVALLAAGRLRLLRNRLVDRKTTWDCGYANPTSRMQYTASSFAHPLVSYFNLVLGVRERAERPSGYFPRPEFFKTDVRDLFVERMFSPLLARLTALLGRLRGIQGGQVQLYVAYLAVALLVLLCLEVW